MAEEQNQENINVPAAPGYYKTTRSKVTDFLAGFLGCPIVILLALFTVTSILPGDYGTLMGWVTLAVLTVLTIFLTVGAYKRGRKFIAIGIISLIIVPLIAAGSCLLIITALR